MKKTVLENGFTILTEERPYLKTATLSVTVGAGSYQEQHYPKGTAHFVEHMLFKGTKHYTAKELNKQMDGIGGSWNAYTDSEETKYYCTLASDYWKVGANSLLDIIWHHTLPKDEVEKERNVILEEIMMYEDDPQSFVFEELTRFLHEKEPQKQSIIGSEESVKRITRDDLVRFIDEFYQPNNLVFVATGNVNHEALVAYIEAFGFTRNGQTNERTVPLHATPPAGKHLAFRRDIQQSHLAWAIPTCDVYHDDVPVLDVLNHLLGGSGSSRLYERVREDEGLCYTIFTDTQFTSEEGYVNGYVATDQANIPRVKAILFEELEKLKTVPVTEDELQHFKNYTKGIFALQSESNGALNDLIGSSHLQGLEFDLDEMLRETDAVTSADILRVANTYFDVTNIVFCEVSPESSHSKTNA